MFDIGLTALWRARVALLASPLHRRSTWRLAHLVVGILLAAGRRTVSSWFRTTGIGDAFRSYDYFLNALGRKTTEVATVLFGLVLNRVQPDERMLLALGRLGVGPPWPPWAALGSDRVSS